MFARAPEVTAGGSPIIEARGVTRSTTPARSRSDALRDVGLTIRRGEMVAIMGPSGCGKTTLLNCLSGLDAVDKGEILIEGVGARRRCPTASAPTIAPAGWASSSSSTT